VKEIGPVHIVSLFCEPERVGFYSRNGFKPSESQVMMHLEVSGRGAPGSLDITVA
jgi:hypothetical protein